jgi:hypothetical protein
VPERKSVLITARAMTRNKPIGGPFPWYLFIDARPG